MKTFRKISTGALGVIVGAGSLVALPLAAANPAAAAGSSCTPTAGYTNCLTFAYTGSDQSFTVPAGVTSVRAHVFGAGGGGSNASTSGNYSGAGGSGAYLLGNVPVTPGQTLTLSVGEGGHIGGATGFGGGGAAGSGTGIGGAGAASGGGLSAIWSGSNHSTPLLVAGGGGGAGSSSLLSGLGLGVGVHLGYLIGGGGAGIQSGQPGNGGSGYAGGGGTQAGGGLVGSILDALCISSPAPGALYAGGSGKSAPLGSLLFGEGGGGGGGFYGGGGGACSLLSTVVLNSGQGGGGGGGSSYLAPGVTNATTASGQTSTSAITATIGGGQADLLRLNVNIGNGVSGTNSGNGGNGEVALEWLNPPNPGNATSSGTGAIAQSPTIAVPTGGTLRLLNSSSAPVTTLTVAGEGTYTVDTTTNVLTFAPANGFSGDATPVTYRVTDSLGQSADATYSPHVSRPAAPTPPPLSGSGTGNAASTATVTIPPNGSVTLLNGSTPTNTVVIAGQGTYTLNPTTGVITFVPVLGFSGDATPVHYQVTDAYGSTGGSTFTAHAEAPDAPNPGPITSSGTGSGVQHATIPIPTGGSVSLVDPFNASNTNSITVANEGSYSLNPSTGVITFTPVSGFSGDATPIHFRQTDAYGNTGTSTYGPHVNPASGPATPAPIISTGSGTTPQTGTVPVPSGGTVTLLNGGVPTNSVTIPDEGTYTLDPQTGVITFTPVAGFVGDSTPVSFRVTDSNGNTATSTFTAHINRPAAPAPTGATSSGAGTDPQSAAVTIPSGGGIALLDADGNPTNTVTVPSQGTYTLNPQTGVITFAPILGFWGHTTGVHYRVTDAYGSTGNANYAPTVSQPNAPTVPANPQSSIFKNGTGSLTVPVPAGGNIVLVAGSSPTDYTDSMGNNWSLNQTSHVITFTPAHDWIGTSGIATYRVSDAYGQWTDGHYSVTVRAFSRTVTPSASAAPLVPLAKIVTAGSAVPVTCTLTVVNIGRCDVTLTYRNARGTYVVGTGSFVSKGTGTADHVVVPVKLTPTGRIGATVLGGVVSTATVKITPYGSQTALPASTVARFVDLHVFANVYFDQSVWTLRKAEAQHLYNLRQKEANVRTVTCTGNTDQQPNATTDYLLSLARAKATCDYLVKGTKIKTVVVSNSSRKPIASNATPAGRQANRRVDVRFDY